MKQYLDVLDKILTEGVEKESGRENMPNTIGISHAVIQMDMKNGFPLLTTKKMAWKGIIHELLWFLRGDINVKYLIDNKVNIWNDDSYRWYLTYHINNTDGTVSSMSQDEFIKTIKTNHIDVLKNWFSGSDYTLGDLGKVYGYQWRNQNGVDQVAEVLKSLKENPYSRYHIINGWNAKDKVEMALPPCHLLYQFICRPLSFTERYNLYFESKNIDGSQKYYHPHYDDNTIDNIEGVKLSEDSNRFFTNLMNEKEINVPKFYLDLNMYQRSCDTALGNPYNIASMSLLLKLFAKTCNMEEGIATWIGGDTHLYVNHIENAKEQVKRIPTKLPTLKINKELNNLEDILNLTIDDFELVDYNPQEKIYYELSAGLKAS